MIPSQAIHARAANNNKKNKTNKNSNDQNKQTTAAASTLTTATTTTESNEKERVKQQQQQQQQQNQVTTPSRRSRRRLRPQKKNRPPEASSNSQDDKTIFTGHFPDPWWRAISMNHVRQHPRFQPLDNVNHHHDHNHRLLRSLADVQHYYPQGSWQWNELHVGRCTTSQAAGALGFLNDHAAQVLGVPVAWRQRGGRGSYQRLSQRPVLRTLSELNHRLVTSDYAQQQQQRQQQQQQEEEEDDGDSDQEIWGEAVWNNTITNSNKHNDSNNSSSLLFLAEYLYQPNQDEYRRRKRYIKGCSGGEYLDRGIRMIWGNTQEATSLMTALNYFAANVDDGVVLEECGMCGADLEFNSTPTSRGHGGLLLGATPDGILRYSNGSMEALEVKNHCPFFSNSNRRRHGGKLKRFSIGDRLSTDGGVLPQYVSQLQLEMLCLGDACRSAVMVRQTATQGATIWRMRRDEAWIGEMIHFLTRFQTEFVQRQVPPPADFFWNNVVNNGTTTTTRKPEDDDDDEALREQSRYRRFVHKTAQLCSSVELVAVVPPEQIQRCTGQAPFFLDRVS